MDNNDIALSMLNNTNNNKHKYIQDEDGPSTSIDVAHKEEKSYSIQTKIRMDRSHQDA